jgi:hypothetical protein
MDTSTSEWICNNKHVLCNCWVQTYFIFGSTVYQIRKPQQQFYFIQIMITFTIFSGLHLFETNFLVETIAAIFMTSGK